jgi:hypothetical protein
MSAVTVPSDAQIVVELAEELIRVHQIAPFRFGIAYDAKAGPARVPVHKVVRRGTMGEVEFATEALARGWCAHALMEGYAVERLLGRDVLYDASVSRRRRMYEQRVKYQALTPAEREVLDSEIPF